MASTNAFDQFDQVQGGQGQGGGNLQGTGTGNAFDQFDQVPQPQQNTPSSSPSVGGGGTFWDNIDIINRNFSRVANGDLQLMSSFVNKMDDVNTGIMNSLGIDRASSPLPAIPKSDLKNFNQNIAQQQAAHEMDYKNAMQNSPISGTVTDIGSKIAAAVATPGSQAALAAKGATVAGSMGLMALAGANTGAQEYTEDGSLATRADNAIGSGLAAGVGQGVAEGAGSFIQARAAKLFSTPVQDAADSFDKGLLTTAGSATGNETLKEAESLLGKLPIAGAKGNIKAGAQAISDETHSVLGDLGVGNQSNSDLGQNIADSIKSTYQANTAEASKAYSDALNIAQDSGIKIPLNNTVKTAGDALDAINSTGIGQLKPAESKAASVLQEISDLQNKNISPVTGQGQADIAATQFDTLRKQVGNLIGDLNKNGDPNGLSKALLQVKGAMDTDLDSTAGTSQDFDTALTNARQLYKDKVVPFKDVPLLAKGADGSLDVDKLVNTAVKNDAPAMTQNIMQNLNPQGQQQFTTAIVQKAANNATNGDSLDLLKFNKQLNNLGDTLSVLPQDTQDKIKGLQTLLTRGQHLIQTANAKSNNIETIGATTASGGALLAKGALALPAIMKTLGTSKAISILLTNPRMTKILIKLGGGKLADTGKDGLVNAGLKLLSKGAVPALGAAASGYVNGQLQPSQNE